MIPQVQHVRDPWVVAGTPPELAAFAGPHSLFVADAKYIEKKLEEAVVVVTCKMILVSDGARGVMPFKKIVISDIEGLFVSYKPSDVGPGGGKMVLVKMKEGIPDTLLLFPAPPPEHDQYRKDILEVLEVVYMEMCHKKLKITLTDDDDDRLLSKAQLSVWGYTPQQTDDRQLHSVPCKCKPRKVPRLTPATDPLQDLQVRFNTQQATHQHQTGVLKQQISALKRQVMRSQSPGVSHSALSVEESPNSQLSAMREEVRDKLRSQADTIASLQAQLMSEVTRREEAEKRLAVLSSTTVGMNTEPDRTTRSTSMSPSDTILAAYDRLPSMVCEASPRLGPRCISPLRPRTPMRNYTPMSSHTPQPLPQPHPRIIEAGTMTEPVTFGEEAVESAEETEPEPVQPLLFETSSELCILPYKAVMVDAEVTALPGGKTPLKRNDGFARDMACQVEPKRIHKGTSTFNKTVGSVVEAMVQTDTGYTFDKGVVTDLAFPLVGLGQEMATGSVGERSARGDAVPLPSRYRVGSIRESELGSKTATTAVSASTATTSVPSYGLMKGANTSRSGSQATDLDGMLKECCDLLGKTKALTSRGPSTFSLPSAPPSRVDTTTYWYPLVDGTVVGFSRQGAADRGYQPGLEMLLGGNLYTIVGTRQGKLYGYRESDPGAVCIEHLL